MADVATGPGTGSAVNDSASAALDEARRLVRRLSASSAGADSVNGVRVSVLADPRWDEDAERVTLFLTCYALGHRRVVWEGQSVAVLQAGELLETVTLDARGQAVARDLPSGSYSLAFSECPGRESAVVFPARGPWTRQIYSKDGRIRATVARTPAGQILVGAQTDDCSLAGTKVAFLLRTAGRLHVRRRGTIVLKPAADRENLWAGDWSWEAPPALAAAPGEQEEFVFCVLPDDG